MYVDDLADGCVFLMNHFDEKLFINIGTGEELTIAELAASVGKVVGYSGELRFDSSRPDGTPRKLMDSSRIKALGWHWHYSIDKGLEKAYAHFLEERQYSQ
jgi:GDP-L-fucose synthase